MVFVDVDDTLVRSAGSKRFPIVAGRSRPGTEASRRNAVLLEHWRRRVRPSLPFKPAEPALALPALRRARKRAEVIAIATNTALIQVENGEVVRVRPGAQGERPVAK
jgi:hypothetical protein